MVRNQFHSSGLGRRVGEPWIPNKVEPGNRNLNQALIFKGLNLHTPQIWRPDSRL